jgi:hypothetical protein
LQGALAPLAETEFLETNLTPFGYSFKFVKFRTLSTEEGKGAD